MNARPLGNEQFVDWLGLAQPGDMVEYYRGYLFADRITSLSRKTRGEINKLGRTCNRALLAAEDGDVYLLQQRHGDEDYSYIAVRRRRK